MRITHTRIAAATTALAAGALTAVALRPSTSAHNASVAEQPAVEVRTQVIRRTIHLVRHEKSRSSAGVVRPGHAASSGLRSAGAPTLVRTASSGSHVAAVTPTATTVRTRASGGAGGSPSTGATPVRTRTSGGGDNSSHDD